TQIEAILAQEKRLVPHYQLEVRRGARRMDELTVRVEMREAVTDAGGELGRHARRLIKSFAGVSVAVEVVAPGSIARSEGKARRILDLRPKDE
ncbi:MAG TPA: phenylacetate--CoA ligase, partial [Devosiaceae bacterium]|nr:phenylacetate--CoA ligase [Devosiaceae bacterium]